MMTLFSVFRNELCVKEKCQKKPRSRPIRTEIVEKNYI